MSTPLSSEEINNIVANTLFHPVFQPIIALANNEVVGYEALTRFHGGHSPDAVFGRVSSLENLFALESATMRLAIAQARILLKPSQFLSLNTSPPLLIGATDALKEMFTQLDHTVVIELTEHVKIVNYEAIRRATRALGADLRVAIDDVGSDYSNLKKIVELHPHYLKLDICLIHDIDQDPYRLALVKCLQGFAASVGCKIIAEGVETAAERAVLLRIGVEMGQGFLLGRPEPLAKSR